MRCVDDFWSALDEPSATALAARATRCSYTRGRALVHEGQVPDRVFVLRSGCAKVTSLTPTGREVVLAFRGPGSLVGEQSALDGEPRSATIVVIQPVEALVLSHRAFVSFLLEHPTAHLVVTQMIARRLRESDAKVMQTAATTITRVAARLLELSERFGSEDGDAIRISLPLSQEEIAGATGSSLESVGRALQSMRSLRCIETRRREIRVLDAERLAALRDAA
jgi:CRP/FNR family transcriptional regulator, cyclic AMP receptor protein